MTTPIETIDIDSDITSAYFKMAANNMFSCPITENGKLKGTITLNESMRLMMKEREVQE